MLCTAIGTDPDIFEIRVPFANVSTSYTNCYVLKNGGDALVIDTGSPTEEGSAYLASALDELGIDASRASYFLTHLHMDHAGLISLIAGPEATVYLGADEFEFAHPRNNARFCAIACRRLQQEGIGPDEIAMAVRMLRNSDFLETAGRTYTLVNDGDTIYVGSKALCVIDTAGHTPGHLALYEQSTKTLFCGDHVLFDLSPSIGLFPYGRDAYQTYLANLAKLSSMPIRKLLIGHGRNSDRFADRIGWLIKHHEERLDEARALITSFPGMTGRKVIESISWGVPFRRWHDIPLPQRCCIIGEGIGVLDHLLRRGFVSFSIGSDGLRRWT